MSILVSMKKTIESDDYNIGAGSICPTEGSSSPNKPVLGICRGVQLINVALEEHSPRDRRAWQGLPFGTSHSIEQKKGSGGATLWSG